MNWSELHEIGNNKYEVFEIGKFRLLKGKYPVQETTVRSGETIYYPTKQSAEDAMERLWLDKSRYKVFPNVIKQMVTERKPKKDEDF